MTGSVERAAELLLAHDNIRLVCHKSPDGDTVGSAFGLYYALLAAGKQVCVTCHDPFPDKFAYFLPDSQPEVSPSFVVSVDVASRSLLGASAADLPIDLCIDHHRMNTLDAKEKLVDAEAAATAELMLRIIKRMGTPLSGKMADSLYTGVCTDTGCFRYSNVTPATHRAAAELMQAGAQAARINREMFEQKSAARLALERLVLEKMQLHFDGRCAYVLVTKRMMEQAGADDPTFDGIPAITRCPIGVQIGITARESDEGGYKISVRSSEEVDASAFCAQFGGGGHLRAGGCRLQGNAEQVQRTLLDAAAKVVR